MAEEEIPKHISDLGKHILRSCPRAYINKIGQVIDPCHIWWSDVNDATNWSTDS